MREINAEDCVPCMGGRTHNGHLRFINARGFVQEGCPDLLPKLNKYSLSRTARELGTKKKVERIVIICCSWLVFLHIISNA